MEIHKVEDTTRGLHAVDGSLPPRKDLQLVKGNIIKALPRLKCKHDIQNKEGNY
jgi:hypothetical protein